MEALAVGASVAGLLSLVGQCLSGAQSLYQIYNRLSLFGKQVQDFLNDLDALIRTLTDVEQLLRRLQTHQSIRIGDGALETLLSTNLNRIHTDLKSWIVEADALVATAGKRRAARLHEALFSPGSDSMQSIRAEMQRRRIDICGALSLLGRSLDLRLALKADAIERGVNKANELAQATFNNVAATQEVIRRLGTRTITIGTPSDPGSSVSDEGSQDSTTQRYRSLAGFWTCTKLLEPREIIAASERSNPDAPLENRCCLCWSPLIAADLKCWSDHLINAHKLGRCSFKRKYYRPSDFHMHMATKHNVKFLSGFSRVQDLFFIRAKSSHSPETVDEEITNIGDRVEQNFSEGSVTPLRLEYRRKSCTESEDRQFPGSNTLCTSSKYSRWRTGSDTEVIKAASLMSSEVVIALPGPDGISAHPFDPESLSRIFDVRRDVEDPNQPNLRSRCANCPVALVTSSWDTSLLTKWQDNRDRINRWMLHTLGCDEDQASVHYQMFLTLTQTSKMNIEDVNRNWSRLVYNYWFTDEAATDPVDVPSSADVYRAPAKGRRRRQSGSGRASSGQRSAGSFMSRQSIISMVSGVAQGFKAIIGGKRSLENNPPTGDFSSQGSEDQEAGPTSRRFSEDLQDLRDTLRRYILTYEEKQQEDEQKDHAVFLRQLHQRSLENNQERALA